MTAAISHLTKANAIGDTASSTRKTGDNRRKRIHRLCVDRTIGDAKLHPPHLAILDNRIDRPDEDVDIVQHLLTRHTPGAGDLFNAFL